MCKTLHYHPNLRMISDQRLDDTGIEGGGQVNDQKDEKGYGSTIS